MHVYAQASVYTETCVVMQYMGERILQNWARRKERAVFGILEAQLHGGLVLDRLPCTPLRFSHHRNVPSDLYSCYQEDDG
jgi:hypothetical protein